MGPSTAAGRLDCHEIWEFDDQNRIQTLRGFIEGRLDYQTIVAHFLRVNECDRATFDRHVDAAFRQWEERSRHPWHVAQGPWESVTEPHES